MTAMWFHKRSWRALLIALLIALGLWATTMSRGSELFMTAAETEFMAEETEIEIIPFKKEGTLHLMCGDVGPFTPQVPTKVPLWLALTLKKRDRCHVRPPEWMTADSLQDVLNFEKAPENNQKLNTDLPHHYLEIASMIFERAPDNVAEESRVRTLIEDIENVRQAKIRKGMQELGKLAAETVPPGANLTGIAAMEINQIRGFMLTVS